MKLFKLVAFVCLVMVFSGCITNKFVYDKEIPEEQLCTLIIEGNLNVVRFNGDRVNWKDKSYFLLLVQGKKKRLSESLRGMQKS